MSRLIYWSATLPQVVNTLFRDLKNLYPQTALCLQIPPEEKTVHITEIRPDEIIRAASTDFSALKKWVNLTGDNKTILIIDFWGLINSTTFEKKFAELEEICRDILGVIFLAPELNLGYWKFEEIFTQSDAANKKVMEVYFQRVRMIYDFCLNLKTQNSIVCSAPTMQLMEMLTGHLKLQFQKFFGFRCLPQDCKIFEANFSHAHSIVKSLNTTIKSILENSNSAPWLQYIFPETKYVYGQIIEKNKPIPHPGLLLSCSWSRFRDKTTANLKTHPEFREIFNGIGKEWQITKWFYMLAVISQQTYRSQQFEKYKDIFFSQ